MHNTLGVRRVRRASGAPLSNGWSSRVNKSATNRNRQLNPTSASVEPGNNKKCKKVTPREMSLSEKLIQEEHQNITERGGLVMDTDHSGFTASTSSTRQKQNRQSSSDSISSGWSWPSDNTRKRRETRCKVAMTKTKFVNASSARRNTLTHSRIQQAINCVKINQDISSLTLICRGYKSNISRVIKFGLIVLAFFTALHQMGREVGHQQDESNMSNTMQQQSIQLEGETKTNTIVHQAIFPSYLNHLSNLTSPYNPQSETPYFWDVHFSGESIAESIFSSCHRLIQACELGLRQPNYNEKELGLFDLGGARYVNVDTTSVEGIERAGKLNMAGSACCRPQVVMSPMFRPVVENIFSLNNKGRMFALIRHPVDRALGLYYVSSVRLFALTLQST